LVFNQLLELNFPFPKKPGLRKKVWGGLRNSWEGLRRKPFLIWKLGWGGWGFRRGWEGFLSQKISKQDFSIGGVIRKEGF